MNFIDGTAPHPDGMIAFQEKRRAEIARDGKVATPMPDNTIPFGRTLAEAYRPHRALPPDPRVPFAGKSEGDQ